MTDNRIKWNWGAKLVVAALAFVLMLIAFAVYMMRQDLSLVEKDYYPKGQAYQELIEKVKNTQPYEADIHVWLEDDSLHVSFPSFFQRGLVEGNIHLYNRVDHELDHYSILTLDEQGVFHYPAQGLHGRYILKMDWSQDGIQYHTEKAIPIS